MEILSMGIKVSLSLAIMAIISSVFLPIVYTFLGFCINSIFGTDIGIYNSFAAFFFHAVVFLFAFHFLNKILA